MKTLRTFAVAVAAVALLGGGVMAQSDEDEATHTVTLQVVDSAEIAIHGGDITLILDSDAIATPGEAPVHEKSINYLNYTSIVAGDERRDITVEATVPDLEEFPTNTKLTVEADGTISGEGLLGSAAGSVTLIAGEAAEDLITGIGSCATGTGEEGAHLTYAFGVDVLGDIGDLDADDDVVVVTVTYTLTQAE